LLIPFHTPDELVTRVDLARRPERFLERFQALFPEGCGSANKRRPRRPRCAPWELRYRAGRAGGQRTFYILGRVCAAPCAGRSQFGSRRTESPTCCARSHPSASDGTPASSGSTRPAAKGPRPLADPQKAAFRVIVEARIDSLSCVLKPECRQHPSGNLPVM
jgi:hypothetical protein